MRPLPLLANKCVMITSMPPGVSDDARRLALALSYVIEGGWLDDEFIDVLQRLRAASKSNQQIAEWYSRLVDLEICCNVRDDGQAAGGDSEVSSEKEMKQYQDSGDTGED